MSAPLPPGPPPAAAPAGSPAKPNFDEIIRMRQQEAAANRFSGGLVQNRTVGGYTQSGYVGQPGTPGGVYRPPSIRTSSPAAYRPPSVGTVRPPSTGLRSPGGYVQQQRSLNARPPSVGSYRPQSVGSVNYNVPPPADCPNNCPNGECIDEYYMDCAHFDANEGGQPDAVAIQSTPIRIIAAILMAFAIVELGIGGYAWDITDHNFAYAQYGITGFSCGAWWVGLACMIAGIIGVVALDRDWLIATCALSCAAMLISVAGAAIDGIYAVWHRNIQTCVNWNGNGGLTSTSGTTTGNSPFWAGGSISQGWQFSGRNMYSTDALYCYTTLSGNANRVFTLGTGQSISLQAMSLINAYTRGASAGVQTTGSVFPVATLNTIQSGVSVLAGPLYWLFVAVTNGLSTGANDPNFTPPDSRNCFCKGIDSRTLVAGFQPGTVASGTVSRTYPVAPTVGSAISNTITLTNNFNAYDNCWQINAGRGYSCNTVVNDGYNYYATSCAFCVCCAALTGVLAIYSALAFSWNPPRDNGDGMVGIPGGSVLY